MTEPGADGVRLGNLRRAALTRALAIALVLLAAALITGALPAQAAVGDGQAPGGVGSHTYTETQMTIDSVTGPNDEFTFSLNTALWKPDDASPASPAPSILLTHGFGGNKDSSEIRSFAAYLASHGYVVVTWDSMGFGGSEGCIALDRADYDGKNASTLIDWLADQDYVALDAPGDPKVGGLGGSYGGGWQGPAAAADPRIDAIVPGRTWHTLRFSLAPNNFVADASNPWDLDNYEQGIFKKGWTTLFFGLGQAQPAMGNGGCDPLTQQTLYPGDPPCLGFIPGVCPAYAELVATGDASQATKDLVDGAALAPLVSTFTTPTLLVQGLPDTLFNPIETVPTFVELSSRGVPVAMIWVGSGHGSYFGGPGEGEAYTGQWSDSAEDQAEFAAMYQPRRTLQWFERHVRGLDVDTGPAFAWFRDWVDVDLTASGGSAAPAYGTSDTYPASIATLTTFQFDPGAASLVPLGASILGGTASFIAPQGAQPAAFTEVPNFTGDAGEFSDSPPTELEGQHISFDTAPFDVPTELAGIPIATVHLSHQNVAQDAFLFTKLYDVDPEGNATLIRRQIAASRIPNDALGAGPVQLRLPATSHLFGAGHKARVVFASTDQAYAGAPLADQVSISSAGNNISTIELPLVASAADGAVPETNPAPAPAPDSAPPPLPTTGGGLALAAVLMLAILDRRRKVRRNEG